MFLIAAVAQQEQGWGFSLSGLLSLVAMWCGFILLFYFLFIRPRKKQQAEVKRMREHLRKGDKIITIGGFVGTVLNVKENEVVIESHGSKLRIMKDAIAQITDQSSENNKLFKEENTKEGKEL